MFYENINERDEHGNTALMRAAIMVPEHKALQECQSLCASGAQVNIANDYGNTALMLAVMGGNHETALYLLKQGGDPWCRNNDGMSAVEMARENKEFVNTFFASQPMAA